MLDHDVSFYRTDPIHATVDREGRLRLRCGHARAAAAAAAGIPLHVTIVASARPDLHRVGDRVEVDYVEQG